MTIQISKAFLLTLAAIILVAIGAIGGWAFNKTNTPTVATSAESSPQAVKVPATIPTAPIAVTPPVTPVAPGAITAPTVTTTSTPEIKPQTATQAQAPVSTIARDIQPSYFLAEIVNVRRHYIKKTIPYRSCYSEPHTVIEEGYGPSGMGAVVGGVTGGVLGNQIGQGRGNIAATVGGAVLGAVVGNQVESNMDRPQEHVIYEDICRTKYRSEAIPKGYEVTYLDQSNRTRTIITKYAPTSDTISIPIGSGKERM